MAEKKTFSNKVICKGGLNSNRNYLDLSDNYPGSATTLQNFEPSLFGGYRRINGYQSLVTDFPEVDPMGAEGKIFVTAIYDNGIIVARKHQGTDTYGFYEWNGALDWTEYTTGLTLSSVGIDKIRWGVFNFDGVEKIVFVDGVNNVILFDGTTWSQVDPATEPMALEAPSYVSLFRNHIFVSGDASAPHVISHSAPLDETDWTAASGAGQIVAGFDVVQIKPFRDELYVFGNTKIKKIVVDSTGAFLIQDVTSDIGCVASDSVIEVNGDIVFLSQDGFRPIAATERNGDIQLAVISKTIQQDVTELISSSTLSQVEAVLVRRKSQVRFFFSSSVVEPENTFGIIGGIRSNQGGEAWEWGRLRGIRTSSVASGYINNEEYVIHGDYNGKVYRQEQSNDFDGQAIPAIYSTPYLDLGDTEIRKTFRTMNLFIRLEGAAQITANISYDWFSDKISNPRSYLFETGSDLAIYGTAVYGTSVYAGVNVPLLKQNIEGSGMAIQVTFSSNDSLPSYSIQGIVFELTPNDRK